MGARVKRAGNGAAAINWPEAVEPPFPVRGSGLGWVDWWDDPSLSTAWLRQAAAQREREQGEQIEQARAELMELAG